MLYSATSSDHALARELQPFTETMSTSGNLAKANRLKYKHPHMVVHHNYHDHAIDPVNSKATSTEYKAKGGVQIAFPVKLFQLLQSAEQDNVSHIVSWQIHGRCFIVHKPDKFKEILPRYFKLSKIQSFQRQLNLYGFQRLTVGADKGAYYHELFLRGRLDLVQKIPRAKVKGTKVRARSNPDEEPDFYSMSWVEKALQRNCEDENGQQVETQDSNLTNPVIEKQAVYASDVMRTDSSPHRLSVVSDDSVSSSQSSEDDDEEEDPLTFSCHSEVDLMEINIVSDDYFDRLLCEMFENDQKYTFPDLVQRISSNDEVQI